MNDWLDWGDPRISNESLNDFCVILFDNGHHCTFGTKNWPFAEVVKVFLVPKPH